MSSKSTIISLPFCHIYNDCIGFNGVQSFVIDVKYQYLDDESTIEVASDSDFAKLMRYLLKDKTEKELIDAIKNY